MSSDINLTKFCRFKTLKIDIGNLDLGGDAPIRVQSMTNTDTNNVESSTKQAIEIIKAGGELVRFTAQGVREAENLKFIKESLVKQGYNAPIVADIHFNPRAALVAANYVDKVRINPGNFVDPVKQFKTIDLSDEEYVSELANIRYKFIPFLALCKTHNTAIRIGVNHGSLSDRIMSKYGDTPEGMVESCMEYLRIANEVEFKNIVLSIKASNTRIMVHTVRLLITTMQTEGMSFPLHLGVTEAGDAEDGRIKSAVGIGALLIDGIGDTIRVSLSEDPELEIPVAKAIVEYAKERENHSPIDAFNQNLYSPFSYKKTYSNAIETIGANSVPVVIAENQISGELTPDFIADATKGCLTQNTSDIAYLELIDTDNLNELSSIDEQTVLVLSTKNANIHAALRSLRLRIFDMGLKNPVIFKLSYNDSNAERFMIKASMDAGILFLDGLGDGLWLQNPDVDMSICVNTAYSILQAARVRMVKTDYISCPGCGRTLFDLQSTIARIKEQTSHLKGLKIGIMGCIVNGPGEMADADYGYVGAGRGKVSLYKNQSCIEKNIDESDAVDKLIELIKENGDWVEK